MTDFATFTVAWLSGGRSLAKESGNTYYAGSDSISQHWMFGQLNSHDPKTAVDPMITDLISLLGEFNDIVEEVLGAFVAQRLFKGQTQVEAESDTVDAHLFEHVSIPFWTNMPTKKTVAS